MSYLVRGVCCGYSIGGKRRCEVFTGEVQGLGKDQKRVRRGGILPFELEEVAARGRITGFSGLPLLAEALRASGAAGAIEQGAQSRRRQRERGLSDAQLAESFCLLLAAGGEHFDDFEALCGDEGLAELIGHELPSPSRAKEYLYAFHDGAPGEDGGSVQSGLFDAGGVAPELGPLVGLGSALRAVVAAVQACRPVAEATIDVDATITESAKVEAKMTYEGVRGYQPVVAVWAEQDVVLQDEFRDGNVPAGAGLLRVVQRAVEALPEGVERLYLRSDSAGYQHELLNWCREEGIIFAISADMSRELLEAMEGLKAEAWRLLDVKGGRVRSWAEVEFVPSAGSVKKGRKPDRYLAIRIEPAQGDLFADGTRVKHFAVVTNDWARDGADLIQWHRQKAGTIEHAHDVYKNELGAGVFPCGRFGANAGWLRLNSLTYNLLSLLRRTGLPEEFERARPKRLRLWVLCVAGEVIHHARSVVLRVMRATQRLLGMLCDVRSGLVVLQVKLAARSRAAGGQPRAAPGTG